MAKDITPEYIRDIALLTLAKNRDGLRQSALFRLTESVLAGDYNLNEHSIKNALWNLDELFPDLVMKVKVSPKNAIITPTQKLINDKSIYLDDSPKRIPKKEADLFKETPEYKRAALATNLVGLMNYVDMFNLGELTELSKKDMSFFSLQEIEAIVALRNSIDQLKKTRNLLVHTSKLTYLED